MAGMVTSARFTACADEPGQVKAYFDELLRRCGLGIGNVVDEHYLRTESGGYDGRIKVQYEVPMNADDTEAWFRGEDPYRRCSEDRDATAEEVLDNIRRLVNVEWLQVRSAEEGGEPGWEVQVRFKPGAMVIDGRPQQYAYGRGRTLRWAALDAYGRCGMEVTHYDTT